MNLVQLNYSKENRITSPFDLSSTYITPFCVYVSNIFVKWFMEKEMQSLSSIKSSPESQELIDDLRHDIYK